MDLPVERISRIPLGKKPKYVRNLFYVCLRIELLRMHNLGR